MLQSSTALKKDSCTTIKNQLIRVTSESNQASILTDIYKEEVNIAIWKNKLSSDIINDVQEEIRNPDRLSVVITAEPKDIAEKLADSSTSLNKKRALCNHIALLVDMFSTLFELKRVGLRLTKLDRAMCPKFHVDKVPCRLVTTFSGEATQWLPHTNVDHSKLGSGSQGLSDETSGIMTSISDIQQLQAGDVALLKGEGWYNNIGGGLVHRSPKLKTNDSRLLLTLDFMS